MLQLAKKIHYNEDDYCTIEIISNKNLKEIKNEFSKIHNFNDKNKSKDWNEYIDIYVRDKHKNKTATKNIRLDTLRKIISKHMLEFTEVTTGISPQIQKCEKITAFGNNKKVVIFIEYRKKTIVENIWLNIEITNKEDKKTLLDTLSSIAEKYDLLIVDWNNYFAANISDTKSIEKYLDKKLKIFEKWQKNKKAWREKWYEIWKK